MKTSHLTSLTSICLSSVLLLAFTVINSTAYSRYKNPATESGWCAECHGDFDGPMSPKGTVFPNNDKHRMHRHSGSMNTACNLCHTTGDENNPFIKSSDGTAGTSIPGIGCNGCHDAAGLRAHHQVNGETSCVGCHGAGSPAPEGAIPPYYGTVDTKVDNPCNDVQVSNTNENWSVGDFLGTDNDGDNLYDLADFDCGPPYRLVNVVREGDNIRVSWETAGGRTDAVQASGALDGTYTDVSGPITNLGVGLATTNFVEIGGATDTNRFYRVRYVP